jgi:hypothetical protein
MLATLLLLDWRLVLLRERRTAGIGLDKGSGLNGSWDLATDVDGTEGRLLNGTRQGT